MKRALAVRHVAFEDLGTFQPVLEERGYHVEYIDAPTDALSTLSPAEADLLVILGGPISVNDTRDFPFLESELALVERRLAADRPTLGICLGAQLMARALGSRVYPGREREIEWSKLTLTVAGEAGPLRRLAEGDGMVFHWHGETFDLPRGATRLASTDKCDEQAFSYGRRALALQFHPEVSARGLERWYVGHIGELNSPEGPTVADLRAAAACHAEALLGRARRFFSDWLTECAE